MTDHALTLLSDLLEMAKQAGADSADAALSEGDSLSVTWRLGACEKLERSEGRDIGLRVFVGRKMATVSTNDPSPAALRAAAERAVAMAKLAPEDPWCGIADPDQITQSWPDLDPFDPVEPTPEQLIARAAAAEDAARAVAGVTNSEGADAYWSSYVFAMAASNGFSGLRRGSNHSLSLSVLAGTGVDMQRDYDWATCTHAADLPDPAALGVRAAEQAVRKLHPRKLATQQGTVFFDNRCAGGLLGHLVGAINGAAIARGVSFLKDALGQQVFAPGIEVIDDPLRRRGLRSRAFDGEGLATTRRALVEDGRLTGWLLDLRSARQLGLAPNGCAARGASNGPSPSASNVTLTPGAQTPADMFREVGTGLLITSLMGMGVNQTTGDYSRGATGFWIENGEVAYPVAEITVASNLKDMFRSLTPANDLELHSGIDAPTLRVENMTIGGL